MEVANYFLGSYKDGQFNDVETFRKNSETGKLIFIHEDATTRVYEDSAYVDVAFLYSLACANQEGSYLMREVGGENEEDRYYESEESLELNDIKYLHAEDKDGDVLYSVAYLDDDDEIFATSEIVGKESAMSELLAEIDGDEDIVRVRESNDWKSNI